MSGPFTDLVLEAVSPWADRIGFWTAYNTALASMFETVYDIVADQGDVTQTAISLLSSPITAASTVTSLSIQALQLPLGSDIEILVIDPSGIPFQDFTVTTAANAGATSLVIESKVSPYAFPVGSLVVYDYIPGWSTLLDPDDCPDAFLPFLAQFNGTDVPLGLDAATVRRKITQESALQRGTLSAVASAVQRNLTGTQYVSLQERLDSNGNANAYWFVVVVRPGDLGVPPQTVLNASIATPGGAVQALIDSVNAVKPGGVMWSLVVTDGWTISLMEASAGTLTALEGNFATLTGLENDRPGT